MTGRSQPRFRSAPTDRKHRSNASPFLTYNPTACTAPVAHRLLSRADRPDRATALGLPDATTPPRPGASSRSTRPARPPPRPGPAPTARLCRPRPATTPAVAKRTCPPVNKSTIPRVDKSTCLLVEKSTCREVDLSATSTATLFYWAHASLISAVLVHSDRMSSRASASSLSTVIPYFSFTSTMR